MATTSTLNELLNIDTHNRMWFHTSIGTREDFLGHEICQSLTSKKTPCQNSSSYLCKTSNLSQQYEEVYVCGMHFNKIDTQKFPIAYKKTWKSHWDEWTVIRQLHSPDTYMEHCCKLNEKYMKTCDSLKKSIQTLDNRASYIGDLDGSYPLEYERLTTILEKSPSDIGFDLYTIFNTTHREISRLRNSYLEQKKRLTQVLSLIIPEVEHFNKYNVISLIMQYQDVCSICLENVSSSNDGGQLKRCNHTFHNKCLTEWMTRKNTCPCCRILLGNLLFIL